MPSDMPLLNRGEVYQIGPPLPNLGWEKQPPLVYILSPILAVDWRGNRVEWSETWEYRGTVDERDLERIERRSRKGKR